MLSIAAALLIFAPISIGYSQQGQLQKSSEGSGVAVWAKSYRGVLVSGLDGATYLPYPSETIQRVQSALRERGLYDGPLNGILDLPTMKAIYQFQEANNLQRCGVPTPHTRKMLVQGSHTDLRF
jgi:hypothetical protein